MAESKVINLFGDDFIIPENNTQKILDKVKKAKKQEEDVSKLLNKKNLDLEYRLSLITNEVYRVLGKYKENTVVIKTKQELADYIDKANENGIIAIDTETNNSLDPLTCKLMGLCLYTPGLKSAYVPVNHVNIIRVYEDTFEFRRLDWQVTERDCKEQLQRLNNVKILTHNGKFDYKVLYKTCGWRMPIYWDSYVAARLLDENEESAGLKQQYIDKIDPEQEKYDIENLFKNILYEYVSPEVFALYSATDAYMTYKLYEWQLEKFQDESLKGVWHIFRDIEMPIVEVVAKMELEGIDLDKEYADRLSQKYHKLIEDCDKRVQEEITRLTPEINSWKLTPDATQKAVSKTGKVATKSKLEQLEDPINVDSPTQLAILLYDILKAPQVNMKSPRGTGVEELKAIQNKTGWNLPKLILEKRGLDKLLNTFIDKLPNDANITDGRVHCELFPLGTDTGRFSSGNPNMQQIPRANIEIKPMFKAPEGYSLICCDLSAAEVRTSANASKDPDMIKAYQAGQDLYSLIASKAYNNNYEDNLEFYPEGTKVMLEGKEHICGKKEITNKAGKVRRQDSKSILIGLIYGRGVNSICDQINESRLKRKEPLVTKEDTQQLVNNIYKSFPRLKQWMDETHDFVHKNGYIDDVFGRRRRLPDGMLPRYTIKLLNNEGTSSEFNPILGCKDRVDNSLIEKYTKLTDKIYSQKEYEDIKRRAFVEGVEIHNNNGFISQAERQAVNFQAQAASSDINKMSMLAIDRDPKLKELGVQLLLTIHDEVMVKCPDENAEEVAKIIPQIMINVGKEKMDVPLVADATIIHHWYQDDMQTVLNETYNHLMEDGMSSEEAISKIQTEHTELLPDQISNFLLHGTPIW